MTDKPDTRIQRESPGIVSRVAIGLLRVYQVTLSPLFAVIGVQCRHAPTCSHYACEAYRRHGAWRGSWLTLSRLARCHPFGSHGFDPVPGHLGDHPLAPWRYGDWAWRERGARPDGTGSGQGGQPD
ncbi:membrane protein insertion efficiency factor YidD [Parvularcula flava]|uniref:Putative membrane protein insertion efficiency factor n=1 Tax=Aquisalinus luteolus TaxID=1566827 RepID=A0A8J3A2V2_9PROT|nr:membrane protein insertion efficiency factor YidD [Aquisalinus luteolus]NHK28576.1 membrane protein insertion efficiency factor YidD [Aquisalinus luteolus]GGH98892.1 putative membrane protein insertion efficiency factor [Aquisalinus luteolus]